MSLHLVAKKAKNAVPVSIVDEKDYAKWLKNQEKKDKNWLTASGYKGKAGDIATLPNSNGELTRAVLVVGDRTDPFSYAGLSTALAASGVKSFYLETSLTGEEATAAATGWALGTYQFTRYKKSQKTFPDLVWPANADKSLVEQAVSATFLVRDLINTPPNDMGPAELEKACRDQAKEFGAKCSVILGEDLVKKNYPAIYEVGKGSEREPRLIDITWGKDSDPLITLVGKGVCFDTGGLDIKSASNMQLMKKDMGGAAHALGLARMIMMAELPVRLRVLIPAVENSVSGNAFRPSDIIKTRKGISVEIGNTDAEGRLVLADALTEACSEKPEMVIDFATLTGAARVALGPDLPAMFSNDNKLAEKLLKSGTKAHDPVWQLPLWQPYASYLSSSVADIDNSGSGGFAGAITAALFMQKFVDENTSWIHLDTYGWNPKARPGKPLGGEALGMRAAFNLISHAHQAKTATAKPKKTKKSGPKPK